MCLLGFALDSHPRYRLVLAANRDENYLRPTATARFWDDVPQILAGRDLQAGGTWLGVSRNGRLAALTNFYGPDEYFADELSRGALIPEFLSGDVSPDNFLELLMQNGDRYNGFGLVFGDLNGLSFYSNRGPAFHSLPAGIYGLSNHLLDTHWPKVAAIKEGIHQAITSSDFIDPDAVFGLLTDRSRHLDHLLPDTGVGIERERALASIFVTLEEFGTRCSTVVLIDHENRISFLERSYDAGQRNLGTVEFHFDLDWNV